MTNEAFDQTMAALRPRLHRYCARMTGSSIDGEDALQDTMEKALRAHRRGDTVDNVERWAFRIAHNASLDLVRRRSRHLEIRSNPHGDPPPAADDDIVAVSFQTFLQLTELQRCAVILKDVLGHSIDDIAEIAASTPGAAKSALQRGRAALRQFAQKPSGIARPRASAAERERMAALTELFRSGDFDAIRAMLAEDVRLDLVDRLQWQGRERIAPYFTRYAEEAKWRFEFGTIEGRLAVLVFDRDALQRPSHFVLIAWKDDRIGGIRDFLFAPYAMEAIEWARLDRIQPNP